MTQATVENIKPGMILINMRNCNDTWPAGLSIRVLRVGDDTADVICMSSGCIWNRVGMVLENARNPTEFWTLGRRIRVDSMNYVGGKLDSFHAILMDVNLPAPIPLRTQAFFDDFDLVSHAPHDVNLDSSIMRKQDAVAARESAIASFRSQLTQQEAELAKLQHELDVLRQAACIMTQEN